MHSYVYSRWRRGIVGCTHSVSLSLCLFSPPSFSPSLFDVPAEPRHIFREGGVGGDGDLLGGGVQVVERLRGPVWCVRLVEPGGEEEGTLRGRGREDTEKDKRGQERTREVGTYEYIHCVGYFYYYTQLTLTDTSKYYSK